MTLPPKIELALGYLGGTEARRIREYINQFAGRLQVELDLTASQAQAIKELSRELAEAKQEINRLQGALDRV